MAMTSLVPGILFPTTGLVYMHTQVDVTTKPHELRQRFRRASLNGKEWPSDSPVARIYDVTNSSSRLILLNNKLNEDQKECHLRAQSASGHDKISAPKNMPDRHFIAHSPLPRRHVKCTDSSSPRYRRPGSESQQASAKARFASQASPAAPTVNEVQPAEWHHYSCQADWSSPRRKAPNTSRAKSAPLQSHRQAPSLFHPDLTLGQKKYLHEIARVYDMSRMKQLKQAQYIQLIAREQSRGFFSPNEYTKYLRYIGGPRKRQFGVEDPNIVSIITTNGQSQQQRPITGRRPRVGQQNEVVYGEECGTNSAEAMNVTKAQTT